MKGFTGIRVKCTAQCNEPDPANDGICNADVYPHQKLVLFPFGSTSDHVRRHAVRVAEVALYGPKAFVGQEIGFLARFKLDPGWHVYGTPLPAPYTATSITFDDPKIIRQSFELPAARPMEITALGETPPVYGGSFQGLGSLLLKFPIVAGETVLSGQLRFQQCSDTMCEAPETIPFELPLTIEEFMDAERK
jgi:hypothetical protein